MAGSCSSSFEAGDLDDQLHAAALTVSHASGHAPTPLTSPGECREATRARPAAAHAGGGSVPADPYNN